ncbi:MAG: DUF3800 domain-containing protein [Phycisphaerae bacterium]
MNSRARYLLFIDESGSHDMTHVDPRWSVFVLLGLLVGETYYQKTLVPQVKSLKRKYAIPEHVAIHSRSIRRWEGKFGFLKDPAVRQTFYADVNALFLGHRLRLHAVVVDKERLTRRFLIPVSPYDISLSQLLSVACGPPGSWRPSVARIAAESRGKVEDKQLQTEYQRFRRYGLSSYGAPAVQNRRPTTVRRLFPVRIDFVRKSKIVAGLELADLAAYPIGRAFVDQNWDNPAYRVLAKKLRATVLFP